MRWINRNGKIAQAFWLVFGVSSAVSLPANPLPQPDCKPLTGDVIYFGPPAATALLGVRHGLNQAATSGCQQQIKMNLKTVTETEILTFNKPKPAALFVVADAETQRLLSTMNPDIPTFNLSEDYDDLRALCLPNLLHIVPSQKMKEDAVAIWQKQPVEAGATAYGWLGDNPNPAVQGLNDTFQRAQGRSLDESSWGAWLAVRALKESIGRVKSIKPAALLKYLRHELRFDAGLGATLSFRPNGQLRQPLQLATEDKWVGTVPAVPQPADADLDRLGPGYCPKRPTKGIK